MKRNARCKHNLVICSKCVVVTDAARRMSDAINNVIVHKDWDELENGFMAFKLEDGSTNGTLYDSKQAAMKYTDEQYHAYFCFRQAMGGANPTDCQLFLDLHRHVYESGGHMRNPDVQRSSIIVSTRSHDIMRGRIQP